MVLVQFLVTPTILFHVEGWMRNMDDRTTTEIRFVLLEPPHCHDERVENHNQQHAKDNLSHLPARYPGS